MSEVDSPAGHVGGAGLDTDTLTMMLDALDEWIEVPGLWTIPHSTPGLTLLGGPSNAGGLFLNWATHLLARGDDPMPERVPVWSPYVRGERTPLHDPDRRAVLDGRGAVVMSNEWSASSGNLERDGRTVNHQYSKSLEFETAFRSILTVGGGPEYFSLLRPWSELWIARRFATDSAAYLPLFRSCNRAFHVDPRIRWKTWCGQCDKCAFIDLILAPFVPAPELAAVFAGREPLQDVRDRHALVGIVEPEVLGHVEAGEVRLGPQCQVLERTLRLARRELRLKLAARRSGLAVLGPPRLVLGMKRSPPGNPGDDPVERLRLRRRRPRNRDERNGQREEKSKSFHQFPEGVPALALLSIEVYFALSIVLHSTSG